MSGLKSISGETPVASSMQMSCEENTGEKSAFGYFIYIGRTSCRFFKIDEDGKQLHKLPDDQLQYEDVDKFNTGEEYLNNLKKVIKEKVDADLKLDDSFVKTYVDPNFTKLFNSLREQSEFWYDFYESTKLCFNILNRQQVIKNLTHNFTALKNQDVVINIGRGYIDIYIRNEGTNDEDTEDEDTENEELFTLKMLKFGFEEVDKFIKTKELGEIWDDNKITDIKNFIKGEVGEQINFKANNAYILKDEKTFMDKVGYSLAHDNHGNAYLTMSTYSSNNRKKLFQREFKNDLINNYLLDNTDEEEKKYWYGFKIGHIILESLFERMGIEKVYPSDYHCIHGDTNAYVFNIVVGGSVSTEGRKVAMKKAIELLKVMGANVSSPRILGNDEMAVRTTETDIEHAISLEECDLLFISNELDDGYFGPTTAMQIYAARLLHKPIAYWKKPTDKKLEEYGLQFIPYECWNEKMDVLQRSNEMTASKENK